MENAPPASPPPTYDTTGTGLTQEHFVYAYRLKVKVMNRVVVDPILLAKAVHAYGGIGAVVHGRLMQRVRAGCGYPDSSDAANRLLKAFKYYFPTVIVPAPVRPIKNPKRKREDGDNGFVLSKKQKTAIKMAVIAAKAAAKSSVLTSTSLVPFWSTPEILAITKERASPDDDPDAWIGQHCSRCCFGKDGVTITGWVNAVVTEYVPPNGEGAAKLFRITHQASSTGKSAGLYAKRLKTYKKRLKADRNAMMDGAGGDGGGGGGGGGGGHGSSSSSPNNADDSNVLNDADDISDLDDADNSSDLDDADDKAFDNDADGSTENDVDGGESLPPPEPGQDFNNFGQWLDRRKSDWHQMRPKSWNATQQIPLNQEELEPAQLVHAVQLFHVRALHEAMLAKNATAEKAQTMEKVLAKARKQAEDDAKEAERVHAEKEAAWLAKKKAKKESEELKRRDRIAALSARGQEQLLYGANMHAFGRWHLLCDGLPDLEKLRDRLQNMKRTNANRRLRTLVDGVIVTAKHVSILFRCLFSFFFCNS